MIHKEGKTIIIISFSVLLIINTALFFLLNNRPVFIYIVFTISVIQLFIILQFFRNPKRKIQPKENFIFSPADGKVVVIEKTEETEYFNEERIQISIFMSLWNVHVNRFPVSGIVKYFRHHDGKYFIARNPKSSLENERTTIVIEDGSKRELLFRQIAGIVARRIIFYKKPDDSVVQGQECGFIKFGSRVDIFLPVGTDIQVQIGDQVKAGISKLAEFRIQ
jgi:phosphatidylserine decarboxylase